MSLFAQIELVAKLLIQGEIGEANALWNQLLTSLANILPKISSPLQGDFLRVLKDILSCQEQEDWVKMADLLFYDLAPLIVQ